MLSLCIIFYRIGDVQCRWLERPFSKEEIWLALKSMEEDKAPGPDGFPTKFLLACWEVVGKDVLQVFSEFHSEDAWCRSLSATFITLIPKKKGAAELKDYQPISLVGCIYKLLAKTLASRLKIVLTEVIIESHHAFLPRRQMTNFSLLANENIDVTVKVSK